MKRNTITRKCLKKRLKLGISWQIKEGKYYDKSTFHLPRQESGFQSKNWQIADKFSYILSGIKCSTTIRLRMRKGKTTFSKLSLKCAVKSLKSVSNKGYR